MILRLLILQKNEYKTKKQALKPAFFPDND